MPTEVGKHQQVIRVQIHRSTHSMHVTLHYMKTLWTINLTLLQRLWTILRMTRSLSQQLVSLHWLCFISQEDIRWVNICKNPSNCSQRMAVAPLMRGLKKFGAIACVWHDCYD